MTMTPEQIQELESIRGTLSSVSKSLFTINEQNPSRELAIAQRHASEAIKAMNFFLNGKPTSYTEPVTTSEIKEFFSELNSGTDS